MYVEDNANILGGLAQAYTQPLDTISVQKDIKHPGANDASEEQRQLVQKYTFTAWINQILQERNIHVDDVQGLSDGIVLINVLEILTGQKFPKHHKDPAQLAQKIFNNNLLYTYLTYKHGYTSYSIKMDPIDIVNGKLDTILEIIWTIFWKYQLKSPAVHEILYWTKKYIRPAPANILYPFGWTDGTALASLFNGMKEDLVGDDTLTKGPAAIFRGAIDGAFHIFGIPKMLDPESFARQADERCLAMYLFYVKEYATKNNVVPVKKELKILHKENEREHKIRLELETYFADRKIKERWESNQVEPKQEPVAIVEPEPVTMVEPVIESSFVEPPAVIALAELDISGEMFPGGLTINEKVLRNLRKLAGEWSVDEAQVEVSQSLCADHEVEHECASDSSCSPACTSPYLAGSPSGADFDSTVVLATHRGLTKVQSEISYPTFPSESRKGRSNTFSGSPVAAVRLNPKSSKHKKDQRRRSASVGKHRPEDSAAQSAKEKSGFGDKMKKLFKAAR